MIALCHHFKDWLYHYDLTDGTVVVTCYLFIYIISYIYYLILLPMLNCLWWIWRLSKINRLDFHF